MIARHRGLVRAKAGGGGSLRPMLLLVRLVGAMVSLNACAMARAEGGRPVALRTPSGVELLLARAPGVPLVAMRFALTGGSAADPDGRDGTTSLMTALLTEGAGALDAEAFARQTAELGVRIGFAATRDHIEGSFDTLSARLDTSADLLRLALREPRFDASALAQAKQQRTADLELAASDGRRLTFDRWYAEAFGPHAYARPVDGTLASVGAISRDDILARHRALTRLGLKVVIVGDITQERAIALVERIFGSMQAVPATVAAPVTQTAASPPVHIALDLPVATTAFGVALAERTPEVVAAARVLSQIIGSGDFDSTLMEEIRVKRGLAYAVSTSLILDDATALMLGGMATKPENLPAALATLRQVVEKLSRDGIEADRFEAAKSYLIGTQPLDLDGNARRASTLLRAWRLGRMPDGDAAGNDIAKVTLADVNRVARQLLSWDRMRIVSVGGRSK